MSVRNRGDYPEGQKEKAREHLSKAEKLVAETGYHRRDPDIREIRSSTS